MRRRAIPLYDFRCREGHEFERVVSLANFDNAQHCDCGSEATRLIRATAIRSDTIAPVVSQANGKTYDTLSGLYASYQPDGNPQGIKYECVGDDTESFMHKPPKRDEKKHHEAIERALSDHGI